MHKDLSIQARKHRTSEIDDDTVDMMGYLGIYDQSKSRKKQTNESGRRGQGVSFKAKSR
jgi:hypothetical protein